MVLSLYHLDYMTENSRTSTIIHNLEATLLLWVKRDPFPLMKSLDKTLQEVTMGNLAGTQVVDVRNCAADLLVKSNKCSGRDCITRSILLIQVPGTQLLP